MTTPRVELTERGAAPARLTGKGRRYVARLIEGNRQGSSGYYSEAMLKRDAGVFHEGLALYIDHPTYTEESERPERSVRDLAARLHTAAVYKADGAEGPGLYAEVEVYPHWAEVIEAMKDDIGLSIRAYGTAEASTDTAIRGPIVTSLTEARSVDFVTAAGAGGKLVSLMESAREHGAEQKFTEARNVGGWLEARMHCQFTQVTDEMYGEGRLTREERITLSGALGDALASFVARVEADAPQLFARDIWAEPGPVTAAVTESATTQKEGTVAEPTTQTGAPPAGGGSPNTTPPPAAPLSESGTAANARVTELERELAEARETARLQNDAAVRADRAERSLTEARVVIARLQGAEKARASVAEAFKTSDLPAASLARVTANVIGLDGSNLAISEGAIDGDKLKASTDAAILAEAEYVAQIAAERGYGGAVRGLGGTPAGAGEATVEQYTEVAVSAFGPRPVLKGI